MIPVKDIAWLAGFLEGEGSFGWYRHSNRGYSIANIQVSSTDLDVVQKAAVLFGVKARGPYNNSRLGFAPENCKPIYKTSVGGKLAIQWLMTLYPFMGARRRERFREILNHWKNDPPRKLGRKPK